MARAQDVRLEAAPVAARLLPIVENIYAMQAALWMLQQVLERPQRRPALVSADLDGGAGHIGTPPLACKKLAPVGRIAAEPIGGELCHRLPRGRRRPKAAAGPLAVVTRAGVPSTREHDAHWADDVPTPAFP